MADTGGVRLSELIASLSLATDIGMGQPMDHALRTCLLTMSAAKGLGLKQSECADAYYLSLLRFVGCNAHASSDAVTNGGDEIAFRAGVAPILTGEMSDFMAYMVKHLGEGLPAAKRAQLVVKAMAGGSREPRETTTASCEVAQMLATRLGLSSTLVDALGCTFEYWNGKGMPRGIAGEQIPVTARVVVVARDIEVLSRIGGRSVVEEVLKKRKGRAYDPTIAKLFIEHGQEMVDELDEASVWDAVIEEAPTAAEPLMGEALDRALRSFADFADVKCSFTRGHSPFVSSIAGAAAAGMGLDSAQASAVTRAGLLQELGRTGVPNGILETPRQLSPSQWERVRLTTYLTQRILARCSALDQINELASAHHERLDGSGYHRGSPRDQIPVGSRVLAAADAYKAITTDRPWRQALKPDEASRLMIEEADSGRLDRAAVEEVLSAAGQPMPKSVRSWPANLTDREVEVLRLISVGNSNRQVAERLVISPKTVGRHIENIYSKIDVSTRPAAALFAMQHDLLS